MTPEEYYDREIEDLEERWNAGHQPALFDALVFCWQAKIPLRDWIALGALQKIQDHYHYAPAKGQRGKPSPKGQYTRDYIDYLRWLKYESACRLLCFDPDERKNGGRPKRGAAGPTAVADEAIRLLQDTVAWNSTQRQVKESWRRVKAARESGSDARYRGFS